MAFLSVQPLSSQLIGIDFTTSSPTVAMSSSAKGAPSTSAPSSLPPSISSWEQGSSVTSSATQNEASTTTNASATSASSSNEGQKQSRPVVGPIVLILFLVAIWFWGFRRRRLRAKEKPIDPEPQQKFEKPELHADWIPRPISPNPREMSGWTPGHPLFAEKPANEAPAQELPTDETTSSKNRQANRDPKAQDGIKTSAAVELGGEGK
ncbi:unnamed protein product [Clonostachys solani]|uniref:Uncharacterized protein n=1 Tax=Clonostachys solani TaxID=160281 RepID=A0A9N9Z1V3_9HYPO|nr:unnamed protein product [Clonostachys solani]